MARINIEDRLLNDTRFLMLVAKVGSKHTAVGMCYAAFRVAQDYSDKNYLIPKHVWELLELPDVLLEVCLVVLEAGGYYVCGSRQQFRWINEEKRKEKSEAGRLGGLKTQAKLRELKESQKSDSNPTLSSAQASCLSTAQAEVVNISSSYSCSNSIKKTGDTKQRRRQAPGGPPLDNSKLWEVYENNYEDRYKIKPIRNAQNNSLMKKLNQRLGEAEATEVIGKYFTSRNEYYTTRKHELKLLLTDCEKLRVELAAQNAVRKTMFSEQNQL